MPLINNTIVFLDTAFFKDHRTNDKLYTDFFKYAQDDKIVLCASHITLEEWRTQKLKMHTNYVRDLEQRRNYNINQNFITDDILSRIPIIEYPDDAATEAASIGAVQEFTRTNKIANFAPLPVHAERTWFGYFRGLPPFNIIKGRNDIPDAWIFEAARDLKDNPAYRAQQNRFCIGSDKDFKGHLAKLGLTAITTAELVEALRQEEAAQAAQVAGGGVSSGEAAIADPPDTTAKTGGDTGDTGASALAVNATTLDGILASALNEELRQVYLRVMGYTHWLDKPAKDELIAYVVSRGHSEAIVQAACAILTQPSLGLITDSGNHYLATNDEILGEAATRIMPEILEILDAWK